jgi:fatty-acyl-CoA synthase
MPSLLGSAYATARASARSAASRVENAVALALKSGLLWELRPKGVLTAVKALARGRSGPSTIFRVHGANSPDKTAMVFHERRFSFGELDTWCDEIGAGLRHRGLSGQTVLVMMKNRPEYLILSTGGSRVGAATVTVSWRSTPAELVYLASHCGAKMVVFEESLAPVIERARAELPGIPPENWVVAGAPDSSVYTTFESLRKEGHAAIEHHEDGAVVVYTSGTTGKPKGAVRKFDKELLPSVIRFLRSTPFRHDDVHLAACPLYHTTAFGFIAFTYILGGTVVLLDEFDPRKFLEAVERHGVTQTVLVPTMLHRLLALGDDEIRKYDTRTLRAIFCTSAPLPGPDSDKAMELFGDIVHNLYGATETGVVTLAFPEDLKRSPGTIGRAAAETEIRLLDDEGREVPDGQVGELFARNAMLVAGYHGDEDATRGSMREGFFSVGDLARKDAHGCYHLEGRKRDMIISGGVNVYPAEVEACLEKHPDVDEVAVIGVPDAEWGERVQAVVVLRAGVHREHAPTHLKAWCKERLAGPKVPREFVLLAPGEHLPRNPTGKILKRDLRARAVTGAEGQASR